MNQESNQVVNFDSPPEDIKEKEAEAIQRFRERAYRLFFVINNLTSKEFSLYYLGSDYDEWKIIVDHVMSAGVYADILCDLFELAGIKVARKQIVKSAIFHDASKIKEILAFKENPNPSPEEIAKIMSLNDEILEFFDVENEITDLAGSSIPKTEEGHLDIARQIVWYVDAMLDDAEPVPISQRMDTAIASQDNKSRTGRNKMIHSLKFGKDEEKSLHEVQKEIGEKLTRVFISLFNLEITSDEFPGFLRGLFEQRVKDFNLDLEKLLITLREWNEVSIGVQDLKRIEEINEAVMIARFVDISLAQYVNDEGLNHIYPELVEKVAL